MVRFGLLLLLASACTFDRGGIGVDDGGGDSPVAVPDGPRVELDAVADAVETGVVDTRPGGDGLAQPHTLKLTFKNKGRDEALQGFPLAVTLTPARFDYQAAAPQGADLRFVDADGKTTLPHEIERWVPGGTSLVWVRVPQIDASSDTDFITLRYGAQPAPGPDVAAVWAGYLAVYHLADDPSLPAPQIRDSSPSAFHGTAQGTMGAASQVAGQVGGALKLTASQKDCVLVGNKAPLSVNAGEARTVEAWFRTATSAPTGPVVHKEASCQGWAISFKTSTDELIGRLALGTSCSGSYTAYHISDWGKDYSDTKWHHVAFVIDRITGSARLFMDGVSVDSTTVDTTLSAASGELWIGGNYDGSVTFDGTLDEVRIDGSARSAHWVNAQHASMTDTLLAYSTP